MIGWGALTMATAALAQLPVATFLPLLVLAVTFEAIFSLHVGVERIGRYLQVFHEEPTGWEHTAMAFGRPLKGTGTDPLFVAHFLIAAILNCVGTLASVELSFSGTESPSARAARRAVSTMIESSGVRPAGRSPTRSFFAFTRSPDVHRAFSSRIPASIVSSNFAVSAA